MFVSPAYAQAAGAPGGAAAFAQFIPLLLVFVIMYFLILRCLLYTSPSPRD